MDSLGAIFQQIMEAPEKLPDPRIFQQQLTRCEEIFKKVVQETASETKNRSQNKNDKDKKHRKRRHQISLLQKTRLRLKQRLWS